MGYKYFQMVPKIFDPQSILYRGYFFPGHDLKIQISHRRVLGAHSQATQDISLVTEGPHRDMLHFALGQTRHQRNVA